MTTWQLLITFPMKTPFNMNKHQTDTAICPLMFFSHTHARAKNKTKQNRSKSGIKRALLWWQIQSADCANQLHLPVRYCSRKLKRFSLFTLLQRTLLSSPLSLFTEHHTELLFKGIPFTVLLLTPFFVQELELRSKE